MRKSNIVLLTWAQNFIKTTKKQKHKAQPTTFGSRYNMLVFEDIVALLKCLHGWA